MNKDIVDLVESLNGTVLFDGALIQFTDVTFMAALKKIYESGALEERGACADIAENWNSNGMPRTGVANEIRARGKA
jgi:hypothetical protein